MDISITIEKNSSQNTETKKIISIRNDTKTNIIIKDENITIRPITGQALNTDPEIVITNP